MKNRGGEGRRPGTRLHQPELVSGRSIFSVFLLYSAPIFTAVDLAGFAHQLDEEEQATMAEGGLMNPDFLRFMQVVMTSHT